MIFRQSEKSEDSFTGFDTDLKLDQLPFHRELMTLNNLVSKPNEDNLLSLPFFEIARGRSGGAIGGLSEKQVKELENDLTKHEGVRNTAYNDSRGFRTIGIGFNLERADAKTRIENVGANYNEIFNGSKALKPEQIQRLFKQDLSDSIEAAKSIFPSFNRYSFNVQRVLVDMCFNLGKTQLPEFKTFCKAIKEGRFWDAGDSLRNTLYCQLSGVKSFSD